MTIFRPNPKRTGFQVLIASVVMSAALGIYSLLQGEFGDTDGKILLSALAVAAASVLTLANGIALERGGDTRIPSAAIVVSIAGFALLIVVIWGDFDRENFAKAAASLVFVGTALTQWSLVSLARLPGRFRAVQLAAYPLSGLMAAFLIGAIWGNLEGSGTAQTGGVIGILTVAVTIIVPVLQRLETVAVAAQREISFCPYCGEPPASRSGHYLCAACGSAFRISPA
ncbi:MAG: hypothetical protein O3C10_04155 [Chloroflexi bacterium]|nr:hypothetical protein [Chloroflexota bacterium]